MAKRSRWVKRGARWVYTRSPVGLSRKRYFSPIDFIPGVGPVRKARKAWKYRKVPGKAGKWVFSGTVDLAGDVWKYRQYKKYKSRGRSSKSSQRSGSPRGPWAQGLVSRGSAPGKARFTKQRGRERRPPWCYRHKRRHWCQYTRR